MKIPNPEYKDLSSFNNDTLEYVKTNFYENQQFYVGKPLIVLFNDLETDIVNFTPNSLWNPMDKSDGVSLTVRYTKHVESHNKSVTHVPAATNIIIKFTEHYTYKDALGLCDRNTEIDWCKAQEDFYKDFIVKEIFIYIPEPE